MKRLTIILLLTIVSNQIAGQGFRPIELVKKVFLDTTFVNEVPKFSTGEYEGRPNSQDISSKTELDFKLLAEENNIAVVNLTITDSLGNGVDTYIHLKKENEWKIFAFRSLAMTGFLEQIKTQFETMTEEQIDTFIASGEEGINSKEDFYRELDILQLTLDLDEKIIEHFRVNQESFQKTLQEISALEVKKESAEMKRLDIGKNIKSDYKELLISNISTSFYCENCYEFTIGGMVDNLVGYFYIPDKEDVPEMDPNRIIMIREIGNGWYLFKTT